MKRALAVAPLAVLVFVAVISAQNPPPAPKPGAEHQRLAYFVGKWTIEADMKPSPFGPGGESTGKEHLEWMPGGFFLVSHSEWKSPMGEGTELAVMGYNSQEKVYTYDAFSSMGEAEHSKGTVAGDT